MIEDLWYKNTIIYSLDLETFMDANGDGVHMLGSGHDAVSSYAAQELGKFTCPP